MGRSLARLAQISWMARSWSAVRRKPNSRRMRASISGVQRRLKIGYNRAARLIEAMEQAGIVTPPGDADTYSRALRRLIFDRDLRAACAEAAWAAGQKLPRWTDRAAAFAAECEKALAA